MKQKACLLLAIWLVPLGVSAESTSQERHIKRKLLGRISITWQGQELGQAIQRIAESQNISIWLDRRVDPQQRIQVRISDTPLQQALEIVANQYHLDIVLVGTVLYMGPQQSVQELPVLLQEARSTLARVPVRQRRLWLQAEACSWPRLSKPRQLLNEWLSAADLSMHNEESIAHDLWKASKIPPLSLIDRTVLLLFGFDKTCQISPDGKSCRIIPIRGSVKSNKRPLSKVPIPQPKRKHRESKVYTLQLQNQPVGRAINQLAQQLQLEVHWDPELMNSIPKAQEVLVSCDVKNVLLDELLNSILQPAGFQHKRKGQLLTIELISKKR